MLNKTVLLIDDDPEFCALFEATFRPFIQTVIVARTFEEGIEKVNTDHPHAVMLDLTLPDSDPLRTVEQFKRICPHQTLVIVTGDVRPETREKAIHDTAQSVLVKDMVLGNPKGVVAELESAIDWTDMGRMFLARHLKFV